MAEKHTVEAGDSYWDIAKKKWGGDDATINENRKRLQALNGGKALNPGDTLVLDDKPDAPVSNSKPDPKGIKPSTKPSISMTGPDGARKPMLPPRGKSTSGQGGERFAPKPAPKPGKALPPGLITPNKAAPSGVARPSAGAVQAQADKKAAARKTALAAAMSPDNTRKPMGGAPSMKSPMAPRRDSAPVASNADSRRAPVSKPTLKAPVTPRRDSVPTGKGIFSAPRGNSGSMTIQPGKKR